MRGWRAALRVAAKNARRDRGRTTFLVLLVAIPVALGIVAGGIVRAGSVPPEETVRREYGTANVMMRVQGGHEVLEWIYDNAAAIEPGLSLTDFRERGVTLDGFLVATASDLDSEHPLTEGMLSLVEGVAPTSPGEAAVSPPVAETLGLEVGDRAEFEDLDVGPVEVVGVLAGPESTVLLWPGALEGSTREAIVLAGGENAEAAVTRLDELWWTEGQRILRPEPAVDPVPDELRSLDPGVYAFLSAAEIEDLVGLARANPDDPELVVARAEELVYGSGRPFAGGITNVSTRAEELSPGIEGRPGLVSTGASTLLLVEVAFITGAAFAAGTRRRLREIGLLGAGGASERHVRIIVIGEGLTLGVVGASLGVLLGLGGLALGHPLLERLVSRPLTGTGVGMADVVGPAAVALVAVLLAVTTPARSASRIPVTTALQGRMPASPPSRWVVPVGIVSSVLGGILITVSLSSTSRLSPVLAAAGGFVVVAGVAFLAGPLLRGLGRLTGRMPATSRLVLRDADRHRTRSAVAVVAIMVILLVPAILATVSETGSHRDLLAGLSEPENQLLLAGSYDPGSSVTRPVTGEAIAAVAEIVPERRIATFEALDVQARTQAQLEEPTIGADVVIPVGPELDRVAVASPALLDALGDERVRAAIDEGRIVVLGVEERETMVSLDFEELPAVELPVPLVRRAMPRILLPESVATGYGDAESRPLALFVLDRPLTDGEESEMARLSLDVSTGPDGLSDATVYGIGAGATLLAVLIVIALVTAVSAAEVDEELATIVAVGAPGSFRRRFLGLLTGYQTLLGAVLAIPLGLGLLKVFTSARLVVYQGPFGHLTSSDVFVPVVPLLALVLLTPLVVGLLTALTVRSAPVTPSRWAT